MTLQKCAHDEPSEHCACIACQPQVTTVVVVIRLPKLALKRLLAAIGLVALTAATMLWPLVVASIVLEAMFLWLLWRVFHAIVAVERQG